MGRADALLVRAAQRWSALLPLEAAGSGRAVRGRRRASARRVAAERTARAEVLDLKGEADRLYAGYLNGAVHLASAGFGAIVLLLLA